MTLNLFLNDVSHNPSAHFPNLKVNYRLSSPPDLEAVKYEIILAVARLFGVDERDLGLTHLTSVSKEQDAQPPVDRTQPSSFNFILNKLQKDWKHGELYLVCTFSPDEDCPPVFLPKESENKANRRYFNRI